VNKEHHENKEIETQVGILEREYQIKTCERDNLIQTFKTHWPKTASQLKTLDVGFLHSFPVKGRVPCVTIEAGEKDTSSCHLPLSKILKKLIHVPTMKLEINFGSKGSQFIKENEIKDLEVLAPHLPHKLYEFAICDAKLTMNHFVRLLAAFGSHKTCEYLHSYHLLT